MLCRRGVVGGVRSPARGSVPIQPWDCTSGGTTPPQLGDGSTSPPQRHPSAPREHVAGLRTRHRLGSAGTEVLYHHPPDSTP